MRSYADTYTAFSGRWRVTARLIARRGPDERKTTVDDQGVLFPVWRYHCVFTDSPFILVQAEEHHRGHAIVEQLFAELIDGPWLTCRPGGSTPTTPGWPASPWRITSPVQSGCSPAWRWRERGLSGGA